VTLWAAARSIRSNTCFTWYGLHLPFTDWRLTSSGIEGCENMWWLPAE
jgi:hypothetical protein